MSNVLQCEVCTGAKRRIRAMIQGFIILAFGQAHDIGFVESIEECLSALNIREFGALQLD